MDPTPVPDFGEPQLITKSNRRGREQPGSPRHTMSGQSVGADLALLRPLYQSTECWLQLRTTAIFRARDEKGNVVIVKRCDAREYENTAIISNHQCCVPATPFTLSNRYYLEMPLFRSGSLYTYWRDALPVTAGISEQNVWRLLCHVALALQHVHSVGLVHLDVKPENILVRPFLVKAGNEATVEGDGDSDGDEELDGGNHGELLNFFLADFGICRQIGAAPDTEGDATTVCPELMPRRNIPYSGREDVYSLGLTALSVASTVYLPKGSESPHWERLREDCVDPLFLASIQSKSLKDLLLKMISSDPSKRPTIEDILSIPQVREHLPPEPRNALGHKLINVASAVWKFVPAAIVTAAVVSQWTPLMELLFGTDDR
eukprot:m.150174 g.150174  ORF g.150174 m.150174 type:complete len:375 (-) comp14224_c1_seq1:792-1916(-)